MLSSRVFSSAFVKPVENDFLMSIDLRGALPTIIVSAGQVGVLEWRGLAAPCMSIANHLNLDVVEEVRPQVMHLLATRGSTKNSAPPAPRDGRLPAVCLLKDFVYCDR